MNQLPHFILFVVLINLLACSQQKVDQASFRAGQIAGEVAEASENVYHATVEGSKSAYQNLTEGYQDQDSSYESTDETEEEQEELY